MFMFKFTRRAAPLFACLKRTIGLLAIGGGLITIGAMASSPALAAPAKTAPVLIISDGQGSHTLGRATAPVTLTEYISYTCPHCAAFDKEGSDTLLLTAVRPGKLKIVYRPFLRNVVDVAATLLVNCGPPARFQGNHSAVLRSQEKWMIQPSDAQVERWRTAADLPSRLRAVALDMGLYAMFETRGYARPQLDKCLADQRQVDAIAKENAAAAAAGVSGTPSFFINGKLNEAHAWEQLRPALEAALN